MRLHQDIILYQLSKAFSIDFTLKMEREIGLKRPIFYEKGVEISESVVLIRKEDFEALSSKERNTEALYICSQKPEIKDNLNADVIALKKDISEVSIFNYLQQVYDTFDQWEDRLKTISYEGESIKKIIECTLPVLDDPLSLVDDKFRFIAFTKDLALSRGLHLYRHIDENDTMPAEAVNDFIADSNFQSLYELKDAFVYSSEAFEPKVEEMVCKNILYQEEYVGRIIISIDKKDNRKTRYYKVIVDYLSGYIERFYEKYRSFNTQAITLDSMRSVLYSVFSNLEVPMRQWEKARQEIGWGGEDELQLVQFRPNTHYEKNIYQKFLGDEIERIWKGCVCLDHNNSLLMVINLGKFRASNSDDFYQNLAVFLRESILVAGLSRKFTDIHDLYSAYEQTDVALEYGTKVNPTRWYFQYDDYVFGFMMDNCTGGFDVSKICSDKLLKLIEHDQARNTEYYKTLRTYFDSRLNAAETARKLFIHRSSFLSRLERIQEIVRIDFDSNDELAYLAISFYLLERKGGK